MKIGAISYSGKATKLLAVLMICILIFTLVIPPQPAEAVVATTVAAAGLTLAFLAACGIAFTANAANDSASYWEGQIDSYLSDSGISSVSDWVDFGSVVFDSALRRFRFPSTVLSGLLDFLSWFTGKNEIAAGESSVVSSSISYLITSDGTRWRLGKATNLNYNLPGSFTVGDILVPSDSLEYPTLYLSSNYYIYFDCSDKDYIDIHTFDNRTDSYSEFNRSWYSYFSFAEYNGALCLLAVYPEGGASCRELLSKYVCVNYIETNDYSYSTTASDTLGLPDLDEKEEELGYVPDVSIPLPEEVAEDTNIGDINDAANAVLDYIGTAGNTLGLDYEYVNRDTNVDTGTDEGAGEGTITDTETGTLTGSVTVENVAADSLVEVKPESLVDDDTLTGLFVTKFPWCIPFDLYFAISAFAADPVTPEFEIDLFEGVSWDSLDLSGTEMTLSFEAFERVAAVTRWSTLIVYCAGLAMITKRMIWS